MAAAVVLGHTYHAVGFYVSGGVFTRLHVRLSFGLCVYFLDFFRVPAPPPLPSGTLEGIHSVSIIS